ncbi:MAG: hypothetical protein M5U28_49745 [Sandaracinaceae bacterium]|nr:hypothetical protein [Sandaracinaceae bacterium]
MRWLAITAALVASGCGSCEGEQVPFGLDAGRGAAVDHEPQGGEPSRARPTQRTFPDGTRRVDVEGAALEVDGSIRALYADDLDRDGDRDALVLVAGADGSLRLLFAQRDASAFAAPRLLDDAPPAEGCAIEEPSLEPLGAGWLLVRASVACAATPAASRHELWVVGLDRAPRALEHLAVLDAEGRAEGEVELALAAADRDEDGHEDLVVTLSLTLEGAASPVAIELPWLDRPSGLARDGTEPERTFAERARDALRLLRRTPDRALAGSRGVAALHAALCREPGRARLRVGDADGIDCGRSDGAGRAATTIVRALAARGELLEALSALEAMSGAGLAIDDERRQAAQDAIAQAPATAGLTLREGPAHRAPSWSALHLSALAFLDEDRLLLRGDSPRVYTISSGEEAPADPSLAELRILDPSGAFAVAAVERRCQGHVLRVIDASALVAGQAVGAPRSTPLLATREAPAGAPCPDLTPALRRDDGGFRVLGWAPQGVVAARGAELTVVPLDLSAAPAGPPSPLASGTLPPAPLPPGAITADGRWLVELRGAGVVVHRVSPAAPPALLWPEGWAAREGVASDPAISPSGRRVAVLRGGRVLLLERAP